LRRRPRSDHGGPDGSAPARSVPSEQRGPAFAGATTPARATAARATAARATAARARARATARARLRPAWLAGGRGDPGRRLGISLLCIAFVLSLFAGRLVQLQGFESGHYREAAEQERLSTISLPAMRGTITGADGQILAMTVQTYTVFADPDPKDGMPVSQRPQIAAALAGPLGMASGAILSDLEDPTSPRYVVLKTGVPAVAADRVMALNLPGINDTASYARAYPDGDATADIVGFTNTLGSGGGAQIQGEAGIELEYNSLLAGHPGSEQAEISTDGQPIPLAGMRDTPAVNGSDIRLTIIPALQWDAQQQCEKRVEQTDAHSCTVVIMQPSTGHILAMAQWPPDTLDNVANWNDSAIEDVFEPGSTAKVITASAAFEHGGQTPMSAYNIPYAIYLGGLLIHDAEWSPGERYTIAGIIAHSSNVGMAQVANSITPQTQYDYLHDFGLGQLTGVGLPGESPGILHTVPYPWESLRYTLAYGQGVDVTALQMASVYATIANGGVRVQPNLIAGMTSASGHYTQAGPAPSRRVIRKQTAHELIQILQQVPGVDLEGGQPWGEIPGYAIAAKTGTSSESTGCPDNTLCKYGSSYIGMAPGNDPQVVVAVNVQDPSKKNNDYFGDVVAGPVFYHVMEFALQTLQIPPDGATVPDIRLTAP
jgi:cell division protein FtsI (penicillin-binding protein 3)